MLSNRFLIGLVLAWVGLTASSAASPSKPVRLVVQPSALELRGAQAEHGLLVTAITRDGQSIDVTRQAQYACPETLVATISSEGICRALSDGRSELVVSYRGLRQQVTVNVCETAQSAPPSFRQDIIPLLTKAGCNAGACHGKLAGQNGFRLSLRGFAPEWDYPWLTSEVRARRIDYAAPEESLMILKAVAKVPHEGQQRFAEGSRAYRMLVDWIAARAPGPDPKETDAARLEVLPGNRTLRVGDSQQLLVRAQYAGGQTRDVTWLTQFFSNDETTVAVTPEGVVTALRPGETAVRAHFQGQVEVVLFTMPYENKVQPKMFARKNNLVDEPVFKKLSALRLPPSELCDDATFLRRAFLDVIGTLPAPEEVEHFLSDKRSDKRARLIDQLLERPEFVDYWTLQLGDLLQNRRERDHDVRGAKGVRSFQAWLRMQIAANRPWNELAREVLLASGDSVDSPQIGYFVTLIGEKKAEESELADAVAQAFLGTRIGCAKCHNHPLEKFTQDDYYHFTAFFSRVSLKREEPAKGPTALLTGSREEQEQQKKIADLELKIGEVEIAAARQNSEQAETASLQILEHKKQLEEALKQLAKLQKEKKPGVTQPRTKKFMEPLPLDRSAVEWHAGEDPRLPLANWVTSPQNKSFSGAMVNRLWKHFLGVGLIEQVDDLRASNPPSNPELWEALNQEFVAHGYDLKHVMRLILNSRIYQLSSATLAGNEKDRRFYSHFYARRLPAEVMLDAISRATGVPDQFAGYPSGVRAIQLPEPGINSYFLSLFGRSDRVTACACERSGEVTLPQVLHLNNGDEVLKKIRADEGRLKLLLKEPKQAGRVVDEIFLATLGRRPTARESIAITETLSGVESREDAYGDLFWALLNTKEFAFNH